MSRRTWALVTGAIRNDFYFRAVLIKLCDLRARGQIEEIVVSTWTGEIDQYADLRDCLEKIQAILVETPYIDEDLEGKFNQLAYERQRTTMAKGLEIIPSECFVLKLRTDFLYGSRRIFQAIRSDWDFSVKQFGKFPLLQRKRFVMKLYGTHHLIFWDDRFFYGRKDDLDRIFVPISHKKIDSKKGFPDNELTMGFAFQFYPFFREIWRIVPFQFFDALISYCMRTEEKSLDLPRIVYRAYATVCVYIYTHVYLTNQDRAVEIVNLIDLFRNKIQSNNEFQCIVMGRLVSTKASENFKEELRKIELGLPESERYTYEEYDELRRFADKELGNPSLVAAYPFFRREHPYVNAENFPQKKEAGNILLRKYGEPGARDQIVSLVDDEFSSVGENLYGRIKVEEYPNTGLAVVKGAIFDCFYLKAVCEYMKILYHDDSKLDKAAWEHSQRYIGMAALFRGVNEEVFEALYYCLRAYRKISSRHPELVQVYSQWIRRGIRGILWQADVYRHDFRPQCIVQQDARFLSYLVWILYKNSVSNQFGSLDLEMAKALVEIHPRENPFSDATLSQLEKHGHRELLGKILSIYPTGVFNPANYFVSDELVELRKSWNCGEFGIRSALECASHCKGKKDAECLMKLFLQRKQDVSQEEVEGIREAMETLSGLLPEDSFLVRVQQLEFSGGMKATKEELSVHENFVLVLGILCRKGALGKNAGMFRKMQSGQKWHLMLLEVFLRMEGDRRIRFFSLKNGDEIWLHYAPYLSTAHRERFLVPQNADGMAWPWADEENCAALAAYIKPTKEGLYLSVEFCAADKERALRVCRPIVGNGAPVRLGDIEIMRLKTESLPFSGEAGIGAAVNQALDIFCRMGERIVESMEAMDAQ